MMKEDKGCMRWKEHGKSRGGTSSVKLEGERLDESTKNPLGLGGKGGRGPGWADTKRLAEGVQIK